MLVSPSFFRMAYATCCKLHSRKFYSIQIKFECQFCLSLEKIAMVTRGETPLVRAPFSKQICAAAAVLLGSFCVISIFKGLYRAPKRQLFDISRFCAVLAVLKLGGRNYSLRRHSSVDRNDAKLSKYSAVERFFQFLTLQRK